MRPVHISYDEKLNCLFASTNRGTIIQFDTDLNRIASSESIYNANNLFVMIIDDLYLYARDIAGKLLRWRKDTLTLDCMIDLTHWSDPNEADVPNVSHGLLIYEGVVYVSMPQGRIGKFRQTDLNFLGVSEYLPKALIECVEVNGPDGHFAVDFSGYLYHGHIDCDMKVVSRLANGACHQVIHDKKFDRYWATDDFHCGLALFSARDPKNILRVPLTNDDVEWMSFNADQSQVLVGCFDRHVYHLANEAVPRIIGRFGPLKYQVNHVTWVRPDMAFALTESGEIYRINPQTGDIQMGPTGTNAVWDIQADAIHPGMFWVAFEDGYIRQINVTKSCLTTVRERNLDLGMIRRVIPHTEEGALVLTTGGHVAKLDQDLQITWLFETKSLLRDFALSHDRLLLCSETGELTCLSAQTGIVLWRRQLDIPLWTVTINPAGTSYYVASRLCERGDQGQETSGRPTPVLVGDMVTGETIREHSIFGNIKRMKWLDPEHILINGNGQVATSLVRATDLSVVRRWTQFQLNTCESTLVQGARLYTTTYGYQLNTFDFDGEILESAFPFEDYATSLAALDDQHFIAGGRGAFLSLFSTSNGLPVQVLTKRY